MLDQEAISINCHVECDRANKTISQIYAESVMAISMLSMK